MADIHDDGGVTRLTRNPSRPGLINTPPRAMLVGPSVAKVGESVVFDASGSTDPQAQPLRFSWDLGDGTTSDKPRVTHVFTTPGFRRLGLTVTNGSLADLAWRDLYVVDNAKELATEGRSGQWSWVDPDSRVTFADDASTFILGRNSLRADIRPYGGSRVSLLYPVSKHAAIPITGSARLVFWIKTLNENVPAWQGLNPVVTLYESESRSVTLTPKEDFLSQRFNNEEREGWSRFVVPIAGDDQWVHEGAAISTLNFLTIGFDSWGTPPLRIWIDGLTIH